MISQIAKHKFLLGLWSLVFAGLVFPHFESKPRAHAVNDVPIAFWSWREQAPSTPEVQRAFAVTGARTLFQRAGQFDIDDGKIIRLRPASGSLPAGVEIHLVYNGTRRLLQELEKMNANDAAATIAGVFRNDALQAKADGAHVVGLQLDIDFPTRLLSKYSELLHDLKRFLPTDIQISITGLPTWMDSIDIKNVLAEVDFWSPQLYGAAIPTDISRPVPVSSAKEVTNTLTRIRDLDKPFYAGLAAYGYTGLYGKDGTLIELRGDIDPYRFFGNASLESVDLNTAGSSSTSATRYAYRAKKDFVLDGLIVNEGETLIIENPSIALLRTEARAVRENAGESLKGICLFRLPTDKDRTTLTSEEVAAAIFDKPGSVKTDLSLHKTADNALTLTVTNAGSIRSNSTTVDLEFAPGTISGLELGSRFSSPETLCRVGPTFPRPCSSRRANLIRLKLQYWIPGDNASATLTTTGKIPNTLSANVSTGTQDDKTERESFNITISDK